MKNNTKKKINKSENTMKTNNLKSTGAGHALMVIIILIFLAFLLGF